MTAADLATVADLSALGARLDRLTAAVEALASRLPSQWLSLSETAQRLGLDSRTVAAMGKRGEIIIRRAGRRVLVDSASLRPTDPGEIARLAREART